MKDVQKGVRDKNPTAYFPIKDLRSQKYILMSFSFSRVSLEYKNTAQFSS
jgi:hypothetical protein